LPVAPFMDREKVTKPTAQIGFIKFVLLPMFETIAKASIKLFFSLSLSTITTESTANIYIQPHKNKVHYATLSRVDVSFFLTIFVCSTSTNWQQSLFSCCTASMEQATDGAETAAIDGLVLS